MSNEVHVIDSISKTVLFATTIEKIADAYSFATQMEKAGLDVQITSPGLAETLILSLGASSEELQMYQKSLTDEIADHEELDFGCTICPSENHLKNSKT